MFVMDWLERPVRLDSGGVVAVKDWRREEGRVSFRQEWRRRSGADEVEYWSGSGSGSYLCWCLVGGDVVRGECGVEVVGGGRSGGDVVEVVVNLVLDRGQRLDHYRPGGVVEVRGRRLQSSR